MAEVERESLLWRKPELFLGLPDSDCKEVLSRASRREYFYHDVIFWAGDPVKEVLLLMDGRVKITQFTVDGLEVILRLNIPGEIVGVPSLEPGGVHGSTAQVVEACSVMAWDAATFAEALEEFPILARNTQCVVEQRLVELDSRFCELSTARVAPRLARAVLRLLDQLGHAVDGHMGISVSQEVLGQMTAMTASTVSRLLGAWEEQGLVSVRRGTLVIRNVTAIERLCKPGSRPRVADGLQP